ncbi:GerAB/ArcD/ProY family transporter [uncultured Flavonifractor sp.]|uniref:GerAB/ArcD/ProY family transporter n=1 Tax=uncultured Flavonifractor sp. TaxID=1193534 RepID=UPI0026220E62|nr:GerAB/ArcD/ProY family transporter [uncultured Flavonifractor sp.]
MSEDRVSLRQLLTLTFAALLSPAIQILPGLTAQRAGTAGWLATLAVLPLAAGLCWLLCWLCRGEPGEGGLPNVAERVLGTWLGRAVCLLYLLWGLYLLSANARQVALRFLTISYRNSPMLLFLLTLLGVTFWLVRKPVGALARAGEVFFTALTVGLALSLILGAFQVDSANLLPVWVEDLPAVGSATLPVLGLVGYVVFAACLGAYVRPEEQARRRAVRWGIGLCLALTALQVVCLGNFGPGLAVRMDTPFFMMVKGIGFEGTFQRVESVIIALWVLADLALLALLACACSVLAQKTFALRRRRTAVLPVVLVAAAGAVWLFPNAFALDQALEGPVLWGGLLLGFGLPALLAVVKVLRRIP